jgi:TonB family protein
VSASSALSRWWNVSREALASPPPPTTIAGASSSPAPCAAPFIRPMNFPVPRRREVPGTATVDVGIDATERVTAMHLVQSSGNKKIDYAAALIARKAAYVFERQPGCAPVATTCRLELTFG